MNCLNCQSELNEKATKRKKYCSDSCRVSAYIKRSGYKPLGNVKNQNLGLIEANNSQFKPNQDNSFLKQIGATTLGVGIVKLLETEKLSKEDFEIFKKSFEKNITQMNKNMIAIYNQNLKLLSIHNESSNLVVNIQ